MARIHYHTAIKAIRGRIGGLVCRQWQGGTYVTVRPTSGRRVRGAAEAATNDRFKEAVAAARHAPPEMIARYDERARQEGRSRFSIRTRDYLVPPRISAVFAGCYAGRVGDPVLVIARDDFEVKEVRVTLRRGDGTVVESGLAARVPGDVFRYDASTAVPAGTALQVEVTACDWPGNTAAWQGEWVTPA